MIDILVKSGEKIDSQFRAYYRPLIILLCIFAFINFSRVGYILSQNWNGWTIGDWVLNYQGGFIRRGLLGTVLISVGNSLSMPLNDLTYLLQCTVFVLFLLTFIYLIRNKEINFWYLILCFSPGYLLFNYYDGMSVGRKEILIYMIFAAWCVLHERTYPRLISIAVFSVLIFALTLTHEMVFFFMPYFILVGFLSREIDKHHHFRVLAPALTSFLAVILLLLFGHQISESSICRVFIDLGANESICTGIISFGSDFSLKTIWQLIINLEPRMQLGHSLFLPIILGPIYLTILMTKPDREIKIRFLMTFFCVLFFSIPLFLLSIDWGRWVAIHVTLTTIFLGCKLREIGSEIGLKKNPALTRKLYLNLSLDKLKVLWLTVTLFFIFCLTYSINHCCTNNWVEPLGALKKFLIRY